MFKTPTRKSDGQCKQNFWYNLRDGAKRNITKNAASEKKLKVG